MNVIISSCSLDTDLLKIRQQFALTVLYSFCVTYFNKLKKQLITEFCKCKKITCVIYNFYIVTALHLITTGGRQNMSKAE